MKDKNKAQVRIDEAISGLETQIIALMERQDQQNDAGQAQITTLEIALKQVEEKYEAATAENEMLKEMLATLESQLEATIHQVNGLVTQIEAEPTHPKTQDSQKTADGFVPNL